MDVSYLSESNASLRSARAELKMREKVRKYTEKTLWLTLLAGLLVYYPGLLVYNFVSGYLAVFVAELKLFDGVNGIKELVFIDGIAALILGCISILCALLLYKKHKKSKIVIFPFLFLTLIY